MTYSTYSDVLFQLHVLFELQNASGLSLGSVLCSVLLQSIKVAVFLFARVTPECIPVELAVVHVTVDYSGSE